MFEITSERKITELTCEDTILFITSFVSQIACEYYLTSNILQKYPEYTLNKNILGKLIFEYEYTISKKGLFLKEIPSYKLTTLGVLEPYRKQGIANIMLDMMFNDMPKCCKHIEVFVESADKSFSQEKLVHMYTKTFNRHGFSLENTAKKSNKLIFKA